MKHIPFQTVYEVSEKLFNFCGEALINTTFRLKENDKFYIKTGNETRKWLEKHVGPLKIVQDAQTQ